MASMQWTPLNHGVAYRLGHLGVVSEGHVHQFPWGNPCLPNFLEKSIPLRRPVKIHENVRRPVILDVGASLLPRCLVPPSLECDT